MCDSCDSNRVATCQGGHLGGGKEPLVLDTIDFCAFFFHSWLLPARWCLSFCFSRYPRCECICFACVACFVIFSRWQSLTSYPIAKQCEDCTTIMGIRVWHSDFLGRFPLWTLALQIDSPLWDTGARGCYYQKRRGFQKCFTANHSHGGGDVYIIAITCLRASSRYQFASCRTHINRSLLHHYDSEYSSQVFIHHSCPLHSPVSCLLRLHRVLDRTPLPKQALNSGTRASFVLTPSTPPLLA